jgi:hypothetical protein
MYYFLTDCTNPSIGDDIDELMSGSLELDKAEFITYAEDLGFFEEILENFGYKKWSELAEKTARDLFTDDWGVSCHMGRFQGIPSLFFRHSGIENIFIPSSQANNFLQDRDNAHRTEEISDITEEYYDQISTADLFKGNIDRIFPEIEDRLIEYNIPLVSLAVDLAIYDEDLLKLLREKESVYMAGYEFNIDTPKIKKRKKLTL